MVRAGYFHFFCVSISIPVTLSLSSKVYTYLYADTYGIYLYPYPDTFEKYLIPQMHQMDTLLNLEYFALMIELTSTSIQV